MGGGTDANVSVKLFGTALPNGTSDLALDLSLVLAQSPSEPSRRSFLRSLSVLFCAALLCCFSVSAQQPIAMQFQDGFNKFETGKVDRFRLQCPPLGELTKLKASAASLPGLHDVATLHFCLQVWHDDSGLGSCWYAWSD